MANTNGPVGTLRPVGGISQPVGRLRPINQDGPVGALRPVGLSIPATEGYIDFAGQQYGPSDLVNDADKLRVVDQFLTSRFGIDEIDGYTDEEKVDKFLNTMRGFASGNTVSTFHEVDHILSADEAGRKVYGQGINLFENLAGVTSDEYTWGETFDAVGDYVWGVVADPVNLLAPVYGKAFAQAGAKGVTSVARQLAIREFNRQIQKGASRRVATAAANRVRGAAVNRYVRENGRRMAVREAVGAGLVDTSTAVATDIAYQNGLIQVGEQEEYSAAQTGISALAGLVGVGLDLGVQGLRNTSGLTTITRKELSVSKANDLTGVLSDLTKSLENAPRERMKPFFEGFSARVARGEEHALKDSNFWITLIRGDDEIGFKGLTSILKDRGFVWRGKRAKDDKFSNWLADAMRNSPEAEIKDFVIAFEKASGIKTTDLLKTARRQPNGAPIRPIDVLADNMARKMSDAGRVFNAASQGAKELGAKSYKKVSLEDYAEAVFGTPAKADAPKGVLARAYEKIGGGHLDFIQNLYIRMLVNHPGTTALNIKGWAFKSMTQSAADLLRGTVLYGSQMALDGLRFDKAAVATDWAKLTSAYRANARKVTNLLDPYTTADSFTSVLEAYPEMFKGLSDVSAGGVSRHVSEIVGADPKVPMYQQALNKMSDGVSAVALVKVQDVLTKSQEYMYNFDLLLREAEELGGKRLTLRDLMDRPDFDTLFRSERIQKVHAQALDRTLENIMSKSYKAPYGKEGNVIQRLAGLIEDARSFPIVGVQIPFGRFFNNAIATSAELAGVTPALKLVTGGAIGGNKSYGELLSKAAVGWTAALAMVEREEELIKRGVAWNEDIDEATGQRLDQSYDTPMIELKARARVLAHILEGRTTPEAIRAWLNGEELGEVPEDLSPDIRKTIYGQLTRQLTGSMDDVAKIFEGLLGGDAPAVAGGLWEMFKSSGQTAVNGFTRFLEPLNVTAALGNTPEEYVIKDLDVTGNSLYNSLKYLDSFVQLVSDREFEPKASATETQTSRQSGRLFGERNLSPMTSASRVLAMVGKPDWNVGIRADNPEAENFMLSVFQPVFEGYASRLLESPSFMDASLEGKTARVEEALKQTRSSIYRMLENSPKLQDRKMQLIFSLTSNNTVQNLEKFMEELDIPTDNIMDLSYEQLQILESFVKDESNRSLQRGYGQRR